VAVYSLAQQAASIGASGTALWELRTSSTNRVALSEIGFSGNFATSADTFGFGRPAAIGVTPTSPVTWLAEDAGAPAGTLQGALAWGTSPTAPAQFFRLARVFGAFVVQWAFPRGLLVGVSNSVVLWTVTLGATTTVDLYAAGDE